MTPRFNIGTRVKIVGAVAEYYGAGRVEVIDVLPHPDGLPHLHKYRVVFHPNRSEDTFYEFQLARDGEDAAPVNRRPPR